MKKSIQALLVVFGCMVCALASNAQTYPPVARIYGSSPFQDSLWTLDPDISGLTVDGRFAPFLPGFTINGMTGLAFDPCGFQSYIILKVSGVAGRVLATLNLSTMECTQVGNLGDNFSSICFDRNGQLFGLTGNGATVPESLYSIDKLTGTKTFLSTLGNGADGEILSYDPTTDMFYHWSGNGTVVYEKFANLAPYTIIPISSGGAGGEVFGALYWGPNQFLVSTISSNFRLVDTLGAYSPALGSNPDDLRGLIMPPVFAADKSEICASVEAVSIASDAADLFRVIYHWGDGSIDTLISGIATHIYSTPGTYSISVELDNGYCTPDTFWTTSVLVKNIPLVSLSGNSVICPGDSVLLNGSTGGTSQWYMNGFLISGATSPDYYATTPGWYNMVKTNLNGCADSSAVGIEVTNGLNPVVNLGNDTSVCDQILLDAQNSGSSFLWSTNDTSQTLLVTTTNSYWVLVTDSNGCSMSDTMDVTINSLPVVVLSGASSVCSGDSSLLTGSSGGTSQWYLDGVAISGSTSNQYYASLPGLYNMVKTNANGCADSASAGIQFVVNALPLVTLSGTNTICNGDSSLLIGTSGILHQWYFNGVGILGANSNMYFASVSGIYNMINTDVNGCSDSASVGVQFVVNALPVVVLSGNNFICDGSSSVLTGSSGGTSQWYLNGVIIPGATSSSYSAALAGIYNMTKTNTNGCADSAAIGITLTVSPLPVVTYVELNDTVCSQQGIIALTPGNPIGGSYSGSFVAGTSFDAALAGPGSYAVNYVYTDTNGCINGDTSVIIVVNCAGVSENQILANSILINPNPASDFISLSFDTQSDVENSIRIFNTIGELVDVKDVQLGKINLDVSKWQAGLYYIHVRSGNYFASKKVIVSH
jgi:Secretion system C-terminal sorting domain